MTLFLIDEIADYMSNNKPFPQHEIMRYDLRSALRASYEISYCASRTSDLLGSGKHYVEIFTYFTKKLRLIKYLDLTAK